MSWEQLAVIAAEALEFRREDERRPSACPNDGEPLRTGPHGEWFCPFDNWRWEGIPDC